MEGVGIMTCVGIAVGTFVGGFSVGAGLDRIDSLVGCGGVELLHPVNAKSKQSKMKTTFIWVQLLLEVGCLLLNFRWRD